MSTQPKREEWETPKLNTMNTYYTIEILNGVPVVMEYDTANVERTMFHKASGNYYLDKEFAHKKRQQIAEIINSGVEVE